MKKLIYTILFYLLFINFCSAENAATLFGIGRVDERYMNGDLDFVSTVDNIFGYIIGLFYFIAVMLGIYGGFVILTSGGEDDKVTKGKNIVIYVVLGLIVIFLSSILIRWVIDILSDPDVVGGNSINNNQTINQ
ncbi:MAG: hypothetical protein Q8K30_00190 [Candidatus Gracilibacteria bacterium]|nr:hypothetical protein [Candidatus Gracilibacteria bacterium]